MSVLFLEICQMPFVLSALGRVHCSAKVRWLRFMLLRRCVQRRRRCCRAGWLRGQPHQRLSPCRLTARRGVTHVLPTNDCQTVAIRLTCKLNRPKTAPYPSYSTLPPHTLQVAATDSWLPIEAAVKVLHKHANANRRQGK